MTTINLKRYYPYMTENVMLEVSDEIAATLSMGGRLCDSYKRQKRRNGECSLDTDPGFEADVLRQPMTRWPSSRLRRPGVCTSTIFSA